MPSMPGGPHQSAGGDEPGQLVDGEQRLRHVALARHVEERGVAGHGVDHVLRPAEL